ncbi:MAG: MaoC/PaaZ C-terminal domain-containing protein [Actinomyces sp.]|nr:MaoC/PaaZ C-terminal domain-containing protein [Actinomyces sp.]MDO4242193.1 MaoC/PaaZ C-terminal domain-containing protein [Actinomyces sp.]
MSPADVPSAGLRRACVGDLAAVLAAVMEDSGARGGAAARRGAGLIAPAVHSLGIIAADRAVTSWDGVVHRRCRLEAAHAVPLAGAKDGADARAGDRALSSQPVATDRPTVHVSRGARGGWELLRVRLELGAPEAGAAWPGGALVTHDFAQRLPASARAEGAASAPRRAEQQVAPPGTRTARSPSDEIPGDRPALVVAYQRVLDWADASGDHNEVHTSAGAARRAGLNAGADEVVAHGLLLGALSAGLVPPRRTLALTFLAPATVPVAGSARLEVDRASGDLSADGVLLVSRA